MTQTQATTIREMAMAERSNADIIAATGLPAEQGAGKPNDTAMLDIINKHNTVCTFIDSLGDINVPLDLILKLMPLSSNLATLGLAITQEARRMGIDVKCNMQSGVITGGSN